MQFLTSHYFPIFTITIFTTVSCKYIEGTLRTIDVCIKLSILHSSITNNLYFQNWSFLARFCFLSERGEYEYMIEYNEEQGEINLLLYYDTEDQWPAVYKTGKNCWEREAVLNLEQNQVINLTTRFPYSKNSGCYFARSNTQTTKLQTISIPTVATRKTTTTTTTEMTTISDLITTTFYNTSESFNESSTTEDLNMEFEEIFENLEDFNHAFENENVTITFLRYNNRLK